MSQYHDDHNWIPTQDNRLLRRIIRDYNKGAFSARETINQWKSVCVDATDLSPAIIESSSKAGDQAV